MKASLTILISATGLLLAISETAAANLLLDPGLEASTPASQSNPFWTLAVNTPDGVGTAAQFQDAPWASNPGGTPGIGLWLKAFEGQQAAGDPLAQAMLTQSLPAVPGVAYVLSAYLKAEANYTSASTLLGIDFYAGSLLLGTSEINLNPLHPKDASWVQYSVNGIAPAGADTLRVRAQMVDGMVALANPQSAMFDDFSLTVVPEPSAGLLALLSTACLIFQRKRWKV